MNTFLIRTYGCQMNELDSEVMKGMLIKRGLVSTKNEEEADLIIFNTCSIRDLAERKVMGKIGLLSRKKKKAIIGIAGCMAMLKKESLLKKFPYVDFILGTNNISDLNNILDDVIIKKLKINRTEDKKIDQIDYSIAHRQNNVTAYVSIIRGCNNFCSYCIVPFSRGREISRDFSSILEECKKLVDKGYKEITLLGQNVNSYGKDFKTNKVNFSDLLYHLDKIKGLERIRFLTSHPKDITEKLMYAIRDLPSVCEFVHFPLQSGSSKILKKMNRNYSSEKYLEKVGTLRKLIPNISLGTDIIVGFPTETEEDFLRTIELFKKIKFSTAFIFTYSPRKNTPAYNWPDDLKKELKNKRLQTLLALYHQILKEESYQFLSTKVEVLVEKYNQDKKTLKGKTRCFKKVSFKGPENLVGSLQTVTLKNYQHQTFMGDLSS